MNGHQSPEALGTVEWEITETSSGETLYRGRRNLVRTDVEISEVVPFLDRLREIRVHAPLGGKIILGLVSVVPWVFGAVVRLMSGGNRSVYRKRIHLDGDFYFELVDSPARKRVVMTGFGLVAERETVPTRCWEWFKIDKNGERATRLQGVEELRIRLERNRSDDWEVERTAFLRDVLLRVEPREGSGWRDSEPGWMVRIAEGSHVRWPSADEISGTLSSS